MYPLVCFMLSVLAHLASFLDSLQHDPSFSEKDIREVETTVRRILSELIVEEN